MLGNSEVMKFLLRLPKNPQMNQHWTSYPKILVTMIHS